MLKDYFLSCLRRITFFASILISSNASFAQTLTSDQPDYSPGNIATFTGTGFQPGETVTLVVNHFNHPADSNICHAPWTVVADADGDFVATWFTCIEALNLTLVANADGNTSGYHAYLIFTDGSNS